MLRLSKLLLTLTVACLFCALSTSAEPDGLEALPGSGNATRQPVPSREAIDAALAEVKDAFSGKGGGSKTRESKLELAKSLLEVAAAESKLSLRYVLLQQAQRLATDAGDLATSKAALDKRAAQFQIDYDDESLRLLDALASESAPSALPTLIDEITARADALAGKNDFPKATKLAQLAITVARRTKAKDELNTATAFAVTLKEKAKDYAEVAPAFEKLSQSPGDADASLAAGKYLCFVVDDWARGLQLLARSSDPELAALARADLSRRDDTDQRTVIAIADRWFEWGKARKGDDSASALTRAEGIYADVIENITGLDKVRINNRIEEIRATLFGGGGRWTVIFRSSKPEIWNTAVDTPDNFAVPLNSLPATIRYVRVRNSSGQAVILPITRDQLGRFARSGNYAWQGAKPVYFGVTALGIVDLRKSVPSEPIMVHVENSNKPGEARYGGWGMGKVTSVPGPVIEISWGGTCMPLGPLEIAVTTGDLSAGERKLLLK